MTPNSYLFIFETKKNLFKKKCIKKGSWFIRNMNFDLLKKKLSLLLK